MRGETKGGMEERRKEGNEGIIAKVLRFIKKKNMVMVTQLCDYTKNY